MNSKKRTPAKPATNAGWLVFFCVVLLAGNYVAASYVHQPRLDSATSIAVTAFAIAILTAQFGTVSVFIPLVDMPLLFRAIGGAVLGMFLMLPFVIGSAKHVDSREMYAAIIFLPLASFAAQLPFWILRLLGWKMSRPHSATREYYTIGNLMTAMLMFAAVAVIARENLNAGAGNLWVLLPITFFSCIVFLPIALFALTIRSFRRLKPPEAAAVVGILIVLTTTSSIAGVPGVAFFTTLGAAMYVLTTIPCKVGFEWGKSSTNNERTPYE